jgi:hypothetical protein
MAAIAKSGTPSLSTPTPGPEHSITGLIAGEDLAAWDACYIKNDGLVYRSNGTSANAAAKVDGYAFVAAQAGEAVSLYHGVNVRYGAGLTPGTRVYLATTAGALVDAATTGGTAPIGFVIDATRVFLKQSGY